MDRVYQANAIETPPSTTASSGSYPTAGNKASGQLATVPGPYWFYSITEEIRNALIATGVTPDAAKVNQLAEALGKFLPLSGGTMTGAIQLPTYGWGQDGNKKAVCGDGVGEVRVGAGTNNNSVLGGGVSFFPETLEDAGIYRGGFLLDAKTQNESSGLWGSPNGTLTWRGNEVERVNSIGSNYIRYESGLQICWTTNATANAYWNFPMPFASNPAVLLAPTGEGSNPGIHWDILSTTSVGLFNGAGWGMSALAIGRWK